MPAEAGIQSVGDNNNFKDLDSRFRGNDENGNETTFYEPIKILLTFYV